MQGIIRAMRVERSFGFVRDAEGDDVYFYHSVVIPPERFVTLAIGTVMEFERVLGPRGSWATTLIVVPETRR
jgi:cold shock CspA family protein